MEDARENGRFVVVIHRTPTGYFARAVDFPGCIAKGASEVEAVENVRGALRTFLAVARLVRDNAPKVELEISA